MHGIGFIWSFQLAQAATIMSLVCERTFLSFKSACSKRCSSEPPKKGDPNSTDTLTDVYVGSLCVRAWRKSFRRVPGSLGHPHLCTKPCLHSQRTCCAECHYCHEMHGADVKLDKREREHINRVSEEALLTLLFLGCLGSLWLLAMLEVSKASPSRARCCPRCRCWDSSTVCQGSSGHVDTIYQCLVHKPENNGGHPQEASPYGLPAADAHVSLQPTTAYKTSSNHAANELWACSVRVLKESLLRSVGFESDSL